MTKSTPLPQVRVLSLGGRWAGRVAAMLLADQGADVVEIERPGRAGQLEDALLARGKTVRQLDCWMRAARWLGTYCLRARSSRNGDDGSAGTTLTLKRHRSNQR